ncbi:MAG: hypothetical protein ABW278_13735 [Steroidobacteraceae bacterium]
MAVDFRGHPDATSGTAASAELDAPNSRRTLGGWIAGRQAAGRPTFIHSPPR